MLFSFIVIIKKMLMKAVKMLFTADILLFAFFANAQDAKLHLRDFGKTLKTASFKVYGKCDTCKKRIENALKVGEIKSASWNEKNQMLTVEYDGRFIKIDKIEYLVAAVGHDTQNMRAKDHVYNSLP